MLLLVFISEVLPPPFNCECGTNIILPEMECHEEAAEIDDSQAKEYLMLELESEAKIRAVKRIKGLLRKPDQIEKVTAGR